MDLAAQQIHLLSHRLLELSQSKDSENTKTSLWEIILQVGATLLGTLEVVMSMVLPFVADFLLFGDKEKSTRRKNSAKLLKYAKKKGLKNGGEDGQPGRSCFTCF